MVYYLTFYHPSLISSKLMSTEIYLLILSVGLFVFYLIASTKLVNEKVKNSSMLPIVKKAKEVSLILSILSLLYFIYESFS